MRIPNVLSEKKEGKLKRHFSSKHKNYAENILWSHSHGLISLISYKRFGAAAVGIQITKRKNRSVKCSFEYCVIGDC